MGTENRAGVAGISLLALVFTAACSSNNGASATAPQQPSSTASVTEAPDQQPEGELSEAARDYAEKCETAARTASQMLTALETSDAAPSVSTVFDPFNELTRQIDNNTYMAQLMFYVHPDGDLRRIAGDCDQTFQALNTDLFLSRPVYEAFAEVDLTGTDPETRYFSAKQLLQFRLNGVDEDASARERIGALRTEIVALEQEFAANIAGDDRSITVESAERLSGLPQDWIDSHPPGDDGKIRITTRYPDYGPFMRYADDDDLRKALYFEYGNRAWPANEEVLGELIRKRNELALLTGFATWAEAMNVTKMSGSADAVRRFIDRATAAASDRAQKDYQLYLDRLRQDKPDADEVMPWQSSYIGNILRGELFSIKAAEIRPYFEYHKVRDGIFQLTRDLFGYSIRPVEIDVWHESVEPYEMWEGDRKLGSFYLDMHPRDNKFSHAGMFQMDMGQQGRHLPSAALVMNLPGESGKGYLELREVETFLHEFGHLVHWLTMNHQRWVRNTNPEWDFIEVPSQMLENWLHDPATVQRFATNDDGEPIPAETILKIREADGFGQGIFVLSQMELADLSLSLHDRDPASFEIQGLVDALDDQYHLFGEVESLHPYAAFIHLANAPYAASYYLYMWSLVIADDMFSRFRKEGLRNQAVSFEYRDEVLASGGSRPAAEAVEAFLGRPFNFGAFRQRLAERR